MRNLCAIGAPLLVALVVIGVRPSAAQTGKPPNVGPGSVSRPYAGGTLITPSSSTRSSPDDTKIHTNHYTTILRDASGAFTGETPWLFTGAGPSKFISRPAYQDAIAAIVGSKRGVADIAAIGDPATGVWAYDSNFGGEFNGWFSASGSSVATPIVAGIINRAGHFYRSTAEELATIYENLGNPDDFNDITNGVCGPHQIYTAAPGWDFCTGVGSPRGTGGK